MEASSVGEGTVRMVFQEEFKLEIGLANLTVTFFGRGPVGLSELEEDSVGEGWRGSFAEEVLRLLGASVEGEEDQDAAGFEAVLPVQGKLDLGDVFFGEWTIEGGREDGALGKSESRFRSAWVFGEVGEEAFEEFARTRVSLGGEEKTSLEDEEGTGFGAI